MHDFGPSALGSVGPDGLGVPKLWRVRNRTGSLDPHFFTQNSQTYFFVCCGPSGHARVGVAKTLGRWRAGPVELLHVQEVGIKYKKPRYCGFRSIRRLKMLLIDDATARTLALVVRVDRSQQEFANVSCNGSGPKALPSEDRKTLGSRAEQGHRRCRADRRATIFHR